MNKIYILILLPLLVGCPCSGSPRGRCGDAKYETTSVTGVVEDTFYIPKQEGQSGSTYIGMRDIGYVEGTRDTPARYGIIIKTDEGKQVLEGEEDIYQEAWKKLSKGDKVKIRTRSFYIYYYDDKGKLEFKDPYEHYMGRDKGGWGSSYIEGVDKL